MAKPLDRKVLTAHDPLARFDDDTGELTTRSGAGTASEKAPQTTAAVVGERGRRSSTTIDFEATDYQRIRRVAKARGLTVRGYIRSATLDRLVVDEAVR